MLDMDVWDWALLACASYIAVMALVRMMRQRREHIVEELVEEVEIAREQRRLEKQKERRKQLRNQLNRRRGARSS